jgi:hypothetical protein
VIFHGRDASIGRSKENHLILSLLSISKRHATIRYFEGLLLLKDHGSVNGVLVNYSKIEHEVAIRVGDKVHIGEFLLQFEVGDKVTLAPGSQPRWLLRDSSSIVEVNHRAQLEMYERYADAICRWTKSVAGTTMAERVQNFTAFAIESFNEELLGDIFQVPQGRPRVDVALLPADQCAAARSTFLRSFTYLVETAKDAPPAEHHGAVALLAYLGMMQALQQRSRREP